VEWKFNLDAGWSHFGLGESRYANRRPDHPSGDLGSNWSEGSAKPAVCGEYKLRDFPQFYGKLSAVGERTYNAPPPLVGGSPQLFGVDDLYIGWRSVHGLPELSESALDFAIGRTQYKLSHGIISCDGSAEGDSPSGYWTNARKASAFAAIGRVKPADNTLEVFYLREDELPEASSDTKLWGVNDDYAFAKNTTVGATYLNFSANPAEAPQRDGPNGYDARAFVAPLPALNALFFEVEYVKESNGDRLDSYAWNALVAYQFDAP
jgi:hypothetical protein